MKVTVVTGTRPQIIKAAPLITALSTNGEIELEHLTTGQHYDYNMFRAFVRSFGLDLPINMCDMDIRTYSFSNTVDRLLAWFRKHRSDLVIVPGDTNSAFAGALATSMSNMPIGHLEAGVREWDMTMVEERNRRMIDHISSELFVPTLDGWSNLCQEKVLGNMLFSGDTNYDIHLQRRGKALSVKNTEKLRLDLSLPDEYAVCTIHRAANVDDPLVLKRILLDINSTGKTFVFPIHPRTSNIIKEFLSGLTFDNIMFVSPLSYDAMMNLVYNSKLVVTDSGGLQKEAFFMDVPCVTLRKITAWAETVEYGGNYLVGTEDIVNGISKMYGEKLNNPQLYGGGNAAEVIVNYILEKPIRIPRKR